MVNKQYPISVAICLLTLLASFAASAWDRLEQLPVPSSRVLEKSEESRFNQSVSELVRGNTVFARSVLTPLADSGVIDAQMALGTMLLQSENLAERKDAIKWMYYAAHDGNWRAQLVVSNTFRDGKYTPVNFDRARHWLHRAKIGAGKNVIEEEYHALNLAVMDAAADAAERADYPKAQSLLTYLAEDGVVEAQEKLARLYRNGFLGEKSNSEADYWIKKAAKNGSRNAQYELAIENLDNPKASAETKFKSFELLKQAATPGPADAQYRLGRLYLTGTIAVHDNKQGIFWYRMAAEQGHVDAQYSLGVRYVLGEGVNKDDFEAHRWFRRAANQGFAKAMHNLALTYLYGIGTGQQAGMADQWFRSAANHGIKKSYTFLDQKLPPKSQPNIVQAKLSTAVTVPMSQKKKHRLNTTKKLKQRNTNQQFITVKGGDWFLNLPNSGYTLQVLSAAHKNSVNQFFKNNGMKKSAYLHYIDRSGKKKLHVIQYGFYSTLKEAKTLAKNLSKKNKSLKPWIRDVKTIKRKIANL